MKRKCTEITKIIIETEMDCNRELDAVTSPDFSCALSASFLSDVMMSMGAMLSLVYMHAYRI